MQCRGSVYPGFPIWALANHRRGAERAAHPFPQLVHPSRRVDDAVLAAHGRSQPPCSQAWLLRVSLSKTPPLPRPLQLIVPAPEVGLTITWVQREVLDARHDPSEQGPCQVAFDELQGEVPVVPDETSADPSNASAGTGRASPAGASRGCQRSSARPASAHPCVAGHP